MLETKCSIKLKIDDEISNREKEFCRAVQQAVHVGFSTRQSRKGEISSWKAFAPAHAGKLAVVQRTGYVNSSRSHFQGFDIWGTANPTDATGRLTLSETLAAVDQLGLDVHVVEVRTSPGTSPEVRHIDDAFRLDSRDGRG